MIRRAFLMITAIVLIASCDQFDFGPRRPANVPKEAFWAGAADGGVWILLGEIEANRFYATIFHETGITWTKGWFVREQPNKNEKVTHDWLRGNISGFDGTWIQITNKASTFRQESAEETKIN